MADLGKMDCHGRTDAGLVRAVNEDQFVIAHLNKSMLVSHASSMLHDRTRLFGGTEGHLFLVADGVGGHASGKDASAIAVDAVVHYMLNTMPWFFRLDSEEEDILLDELRVALRRSQDAVLELARGTDREGMGTALTMGYLLWPRLFVVHVGGSRCYVLRDGELQRITTDHTEAHPDNGGNGGADRPSRAPFGDVLWNAIGGGESELFVDAYLARLEIGDALLLCTDGLTRQVDEDRIRDCLATCASAEAACESLVEGSNLAGGDDNVTAVVAYFRKSDPDLVPAGGDPEDVTTRAAEPPREPEPAVDAPEPTRMDD